MKVVNLVALSILGVAKRAIIKLGTWSGHTDFVIVKMDDFGILTGTLGKMLSRNWVQPHCHPSEHQVFLME